MNPSNELSPVLTQTGPMRPLEFVLDVNYVLQICP